MATRRTMLAFLGAAVPAVVLGEPAAPSSEGEAVRLDDPRIRVVENAWIPMVDGIRLAARLFLPADAGREPAGAVLEYLPYRKRDAYRYRDDVAGPTLAAQGIALVRVDIRGTGDSDGVMVDEYQSVEQADALETIAWIARQPWCNGRIGMRGISYGAFTALQAAAKAPPALTAIVSACGTDQRYLDDVHYRGGCLIQNQFDWAMEWQVVMRAPPDPEIVGADRWRTMWRERLDAAGPLTIGWTEHQIEDAKWREGSIDDFGAIRAAIFNVAGTLDSYLPSATRMMRKAPRVAQKALIGPWAHQWPGYPAPAGQSGPAAADGGAPGPGVDWLPIEARWWRHWLLGEANGIMDEPRFWAFRNDLASGASFPRDTIGAWVAEPGWPSPRLTTRRLYLNADGLGAEPTESRRLVHRTNLTIGFANRTSDSSGDPADWWRDQAGDDAGCLLFDGAILAAPLDLVGEAVFHIRVRANRPVAKLCARLTELTPEGHSHFVTYALLNLTHRTSHAQPAPLEPGHDYDVALTAQFACYRFSPGNRIRVALSETWWPVVWPSPEHVTLEVTAGLSCVDLPLRDPKTPPDALPFTEIRDRFDVPGAKPAPYLDRLGGVAITGPPGSRTFTLIDGSTVPVLEPVAGIGTVYGEAYRLRRTIREDDPNSAEIEAEAINSYERGDWRVRLRAWSRTRSTAATFLCEESFEAWDGDDQICSRKWERAIPRILV